MIERSYRGLIENQALEDKHCISFLIIVITYLPKYHKNGHVQIFLQIQTFNCFIVISYLPKYHKNGHVQMFVQIQTFNCHIVISYLPKYHKNGHVQILVQIQTFNCHIVNTHEQWASQVLGLGTIMGAWE